MNLGNLKPDWQSDDGSIALFCADCMDILPQLSDGCLDCVVTDIPYGKVNRASSGLRNLNTGAADDETFPLAFAIAESARLVTGSVYGWCGTEQVSELHLGFADSGMTTRLCIWHKMNPSPHKRRAALA